MVKQISLDSWSLQHLTDLLKEGSRVVAKTNTPIVLYRQTMEEEEDSYEEIVCTLTSEYVVEQLIVSGGMVVPTINQKCANNQPNCANKVCQEVCQDCWHSAQKGV